MEGSAAQYVFPAEWEEHQAIWMAWPEYSARIVGKPLATPMLDMVLALLPHVDVRLLVNGDQQRQVVELLQQRGYDAQKKAKGQLYFEEVDHYDVWMRDFGPIFLRPESGGGPMRVLFFDWNNWGYEGHLKVDVSTIPDKDVGKHVATKHNLDIVHAGFVSEGGDREFNGRGTLIVTEAVELQRNPHMSKETLTQRFKEVFNVTKVIWLHKGLADDYQAFTGPLPGGVFNMSTTGGHIDEFCRFVNPTTILLAQVIEEEQHTAIGQISHVNMEHNLRILQNETDQDGNKFNIIRVSLPPTTFTAITPADDAYKAYTEIIFEDPSVQFDGIHPVTGVVPGSYLNFLVSNGVVLVPYYYKEGRSDIYKTTDSQALQTLREVYPNHNIVQIDAENINYGGGGMHCITQQQPKQL